MNFFDRFNGFDRFKGGSSDVDLRRSNVNTVQMNIGRSDVCNYYPTHDNLDYIRHNYSVYDTVDIVSPKSKWYGKIGIIYRIAEDKNDVDYLVICLLGRREDHTQDHPPKNMRRFTATGVRIRLPMVFYKEDKLEDFEAGQDYNKRDIPDHIRQLEKDIQRLVSIAQQDRYDAQRRRDNARGYRYHELPDLPRVDDGRIPPSTFYREAMEHYIVSDSEDDEDDTVIVSIKQEQE
jgi:hypothetical protein